MGVDRKKEKPDYEPLVAKGKPLETVSSVKVLGLHIRWDLKRNISIQKRLLIKRGIVKKLETLHGSLNKTKA